MTDIIWDPRPLYVFNQTNEEAYKIIEKRYYDFLDGVNNLNKEPVKVFNPLKSSIVGELNLIRDVSKELQIKKDEDIRKSKAAETEENTDEKAEEKTDQEATEQDEQVDADKSDA